MDEWMFGAPGRLTDFREPRKWHDVMAKEAENIILILVQTALGRPPRDEQELEQTAATLAYVNPVVSRLPVNAETVAIAPWGAFPRAVRRRAPWKDLPPAPGDAGGIYRAADHVGNEDFRPGVFVDRHDNVLHLPVRHRQDEYVEWILRRNAEGSIVKAVFVAEGYDYFASLFEHDEQRVLDLYKEFTGVSELKVDDLRARHGIYRRTPQGGVLTVVEPGGFNSRNRYNIAPGIVHLSHRANSLGAEVNLAGVSGIVRVNKSGQALDGVDAERLLCCAQGGNPNRNSDPLIAQQAYNQVLDGYRYTLANPVGLYIADFDPTKSLLLPNNKTPVPREWWHVRRGSAEERRILRLELEVPASEKLTVSDLLVDGSPVRFGGQLAELLTAHLYVTRWKRSTSGLGPKVGCDATCCREENGETLVLSDGSCDAGYVLKFDDLLPAPAGPIPRMFAVRAGREHPSSAVSGRGLA